MNQVMPTHWESSERPLFVRTVVVNGSRHAILSQVDPLCQTRKSDSSSEYFEPNRKIINSRRIRSCYQFKRDITSELQKCLIKLRVVLSTQEERTGLNKEVKDDKPARENWKRIRKRITKSQETDRKELINKDIKLEDFTGFKKGNNYFKTICKKESQDNSEDTDNSNKPENENSIKDITKITERMNMTRKILPLTETTQELFRNYSSYFFPVVYIKANGLIWDDTSEESTISKNMNNPLSERVLQWLDLSKKRKENLNNEKSKSIIQNQSTTEKTYFNTDDKAQNKKNKSIHYKIDGSINKIMTQLRDEDVEDEVKNESDIETVLSTITTREYPKFSRKSNKLHIIKNDSSINQRQTIMTDEEYWEKIMKIPEKTSEFSLTEQLQQSILESFEAIVNLERKVAIERTDRIQSSRNKSSRKITRNSSGITSRKKNVLMNQTIIRISSDEEETTENVFIKDRSNNMRKRNEYYNGKKSWKYHNQKIISVNEENLEPTEDIRRQVRIIYNKKPLTVVEKNQNGHQIWATEKGTKKPHLHIFMPGINSKFLENHEDNSSDIESIVK